MIIGISGKIGSGKDTVAQIFHALDWGFENDKILHLIENDKHLADFNWKTKRWADSLKDTVCKWIGCTREQLEDREFKEKPLGKEWECWEVQFNDAEEAESELVLTTDKQAAEALHKDYPTKVEPPVLRTMTPRKLMQLLGTEAGRQTLHPNIWVNVLMSEYESKMKPAPLGPDEYPNWLIPDTRFPNEAKAVRDRDGILIRINRYKDPREDMIGTDASTWSPNTHPSEIGLDDWDDWDYIIDNNGSLEELLEQVKEIYDKIMD